MPHEQNLDWLSVKDAASTAGLPERTFQDRVKKLDDARDPRIRWVTGRGGKRREVHSSLLDDLNGAMDTHATEYLAQLVEQRDIETGFARAEIAELKQQLAEANTRALTQENERLREDNRRLRRALRIITEDEKSDAAD